MAASTWWPTPTTPSKWFTAEQIANSRAYHRPPATMSLVASLVAFGLTLAVSFVSAGGRAEAGWLLTPLAAFVPLLAYNWWYHDRHRPAFGAEAKPRSQILVGSLVTTTVAFMVLNAFMIIVRSVGVTLGSLVLVVGISIAAALVVPGLVDRSELAAVSPSAVTPFAAIAEWARVRCDFRVDQSSAEVNARASRVQGKSTVVLSAGLLEQPAELQSLVVAHEIAHLKLSHPTKLRLMTVAQAGFVAFLGWLAALLFQDSLTDAGAYPLLAAGLLAIWYLTIPAMAFVQRHFERQADEGGYELLGTVSTNLGRQLHAKTYSNLEPGLGQKLFSCHPPPAERLELISRRIQTL